MSASRAVAQLIEDQYGIISRRQARAEGLSIKAIDRKVASGLWEPAYRGVFRLSGTARTWEQKVMAACMAAGVEAVASHRSAGTLYGLPGLPRWLELTVPASRHVRIPGVAAHRSALWTPDDTFNHNGIPLTSPARTIVDLSAEISHTRLAAIVDHALGNRLVRRRELQETALALRDRGRKGTDPILRLFDERPEAEHPERPMQTGIESLLFAVLKRYGVPLPVRQFRVVLSDGSVVYLDFAYPDLLLALEADSYRHHSTLTAWSHDHTRNQELIADGWSILPITHKGLEADPSGVAFRVQRAHGSRSRQPA